MTAGVANGLFCAIPIPTITKQALCHHGANRGTSLRLLSVYDANYMSPVIIFKSSENNSSHIYMYNRFL